MIAPGCDMTAGLFVSALAMFGAAAVALTSVGLVLCVTITIPSFYDGPK